MVIVPSPLQTYATDNVHYFKVTQLAMLSPPHVVVDAQQDKLDFSVAYALFVTAACVLVCGTCSLLIWVVRVEREQDREDEQAAARLDANMRRLRGEVDQGVATELSELHAAAVLRESGRAPLEAAASEVRRPCVRGAPCA